MTVVTQNLTKLEVGLKKKVAYMMMMMIDLAQKLRVQNFSTDESRKRNGNRIYVSIF